MNRNLMLSLRWAARSLALTWFGIISAVVVCSVQGTGWIAVGLLALGLVGFFLSFRKEFVGGIMLIISGIALGAYSLWVGLTQVEPQPFVTTLSAALFMGVPFALSGGVFLVTWRRSGEPVW